MIVAAFDWQTVLSLVCVAIAVGYVARRVYHRLIASRSGSRVSGCGSCSQNVETGIRHKPLVNITLAPGVDAPQHSGGRRETSSK